MTPNKVGEVDPSLNILWAMFEFFVLCLAARDLALMTKNDGPGIPLLVNRANGLRALCGESSAALNPNSGYAIVSENWELVQALVFAFQGARLEYNFDWGRILGREEVFAQKGLESHLFENFAKSVAQRYKKNNNTGGRIW